MRSRKFIHMGSTNRRLTIAPILLLSFERISAAGYASTRQMAVVITAYSKERSNTERLAAESACSRYFVVKIISPVSVVVKTA